jgi:hypothetical protein
MGAKGVDGSGENSVAGINGTGPCPVVTLAPMLNNLSVSLGCYPGLNDASEIGETGNSSTAIVHTCTVANIPIQKWVHFTMSVYNRTMDIYLNGKLVKTCLLPGVANVTDKSQLYLTPMGGFDGWTSKLQYYADALNPQDVWNMYVKGYGSWFGNLFGSYSVKLSLLENGETQKSVTF